MNDKGDLTSFQYQYTTFSNYVEIVIFDDLFIINSILVKFPINNYFDFYTDYLFLFDIKKGESASTFRNICDLF